MLLAVQNPAPALPLVFLGWRTVALPLAAWVLGAIALGGLTSLFLAGLLSLHTPPPVRKSQRHSRGPSGPAQRSWAAAPTPAAATPDPAETSQDQEDNTPSFTGESPAPESDWQDWSNVSSPSQWEDWDKTRRQSSPEASQRARRSGSSERGGPHR
ncbi:LapA family protein [Halomicronema hongdechloris]|uniref:LapA family protein n=1 Tax=Halomicronema hongdechloris TaxID=1209493 RepID=UPI000B4D1B6D|nr:LapA family protein [Halomicronema hongdechloris]